MFGSLQNDRKDKNMKKVLLIISLLLLLPLNINCKALLVKNYKGDIVMGNPNICDTDYSKGVLIYTPKNNNYLYIAKGEMYRDVSFSENKDQILGITGECSIVEYNINEKKTITITEGIKGEPYSNVKYVPKSNNISFASVDLYLYIYNRTTKENRLVTQLDGDYAWSKNGKKLYYSDNMVIYRMDIESKKTVSIDKGFDPQLSADNNYIVFKTARDELTVREIKTDKEWKYKTTVGIDYYKFSPDAQQIAIIQANTSWKYIYGQQLLVWNFKNNEKVTLIEHISQGFGCNFDWK